MKKVIAALLAGSFLFWFAGCSNDVTDSAKNNGEFGSLTILKDARAVSDISKASVKVYYGTGADDFVMSAEDTDIANGKSTFDAVVENIPVGKNRVIEVTGKNSSNETEKIIYLVKDIVAGSNTAKVVDGANSAKGKAYRELLKNGEDVSSIDITGFVAGKSSELFEAEKFVAAYKLDKNVNPADFYTDPLKDKVIIFVKASSAPAIWVWQEEGGVTDGAKVLGCDWNSRPKMVVVEEGYMNNPSGWFMFDLTNCNFIKGKKFNIKLDSGINIDTGMTSTFWYDGTSFHDSDPTTVPVDTDVTLSDIKVNGISIGSSSKVYTIGKTVTSASVTVTTTSSNATAEISDNGSAFINPGESKSFTITVKNNGNTESYTITVSRPAADDVTLSSVTVGGKSAALSETTYSVALSGKDDSKTAAIIATATDSDANVKINPSSVTILDGESQTATIQVTNGGNTASYTLTVSYTKQTEPESEYYWTNKNGYGTEKTISAWSDWSENDKIAQGAANDDPRVFCHWSMHENPNDAYAMYAAYDDTNLYVMVELANVQDIVAPGENYPLSDNGQYWNRGTPFFFAFDTGKGKGGDGSMIAEDDPYVWNSQVQFSENNVDQMIVCHSLPSKGTPGLFKTNSDGKFSYDKSLCLTFEANGIEVTWDGGANKTQGLISKNLYGIKAVGKDQGRLAANIYTDDYVDFYSSEIGHNANLDLKWQIKIPLASLGIDKAYVKSHGIGIMFVLSDGGSGMDCLPWDPTMVDNAATPYSKDESSSAEKEDLDIITVPFARIGK